MIIILAIAHTIGALIWFSALWSFRHYTPGKRWWAYARIVGAALVWEALVVIVAWDHRPRWVTDEATGVPARTRGQREEALRGILKANEQIAHALAFADLDDELGLRELEASFGQQQSAVVQLIDDLTSIANQGEQNDEARSGATPYGARHGDRNVPRANPAAHEPHEHGNTGADQNEGQEGENGIPPGGAA